MKYHIAAGVCGSLVVLLMGCSEPQEIAETGAGALATAGSATAGAVATTGETGLAVVGESGEAVAAVTRGMGEAATEVTGGQGGATKEVKNISDGIAQKRQVDFMGNEVEINPSQDKKIRMEF